MLVKADAGLGCEISRIPDRLVRIRRSGARQTGSTIFNRT
jgi:hypothetical protein